MGLESSKKWNGPSILLLNKITKKVGPGPPGLLGDYTYTSLGAHYEHQNKIFSFMRVTCHCKI